MHPEYWTFKDEEVTWGSVPDLPVIKTMLLEMVIIGLEKSQQYTTTMGRKGENKILYWWLWFKGYWQYIFLHRRMLGSRGENAGNTE